MTMTKGLVLLVATSAGIVDGTAGPALGQLGPPALVSAVSRMRHGQTYDLDIWLTTGGWATSETRSGGPTSIIMTYDRVLAITSASIVEVAGATPVYAAIDDNMLEVDLADVVDKSCVAIVVRGLGSAADPSAVARSHVVKVLVRLGDVTNDGMVRGPANLLPGHPAFWTADVSHVQHYGPTGPLAPGTAKYDLNRSGGYDAEDLALVKAAVADDAVFCQYADTDQDGVDDAADLCPETVQGADSDLDGCSPFIPGDFNRDGAVDGSDVEAFVSCVSGPAVVQWIDDCIEKDIDFDMDVDQTDFGILQRCFSGAGKPADPSCAG